MVEKKWDTYNIIIYNVSPALVIITIMYHLINVENAYHKC